MRDQKPISSGNTATRFFRAALLLSAALYLSLVIVHLSPQRRPILDPQDENVSTLLSSHPDIVLAREETLSCVQVELVALPAELRPVRYNRPAIKRPAVQGPATEAMACVRDLAATARATAAESRPALADPFQGTTVALLRTGGDEPSAGAVPAPDHVPDVPAAEVAQAANDTGPTDDAAPDAVVAIVEPPQPEAEPVRKASAFATTHTVEHRDTLFQIAKAHDLSIEELARVNGMSKDDTLRTGETLFIPHCDGKVVKVNNGDSLWDLCQRYKVRMAQALEANALEDPSRLQVGEKVFLPGAKEPVRPAPEFIWPLEGRFTSGYGWRKHPMGGGQYSFHYGIDIAAPRGANISASKDGVVTYAGWRGALGRTIILSHAGGYTTRYGHMSRLLVKRGERVRQGEVVGTVGSTGNSTGPHCHFEVLRNGRAVDPMSLLAKQPTASR